MNLPFCDVCPINNKCIPDLKLFKEVTGNKRIPPEEYCKKQFELNNEPFDDFYRKILIIESGNLHNLIQIFPDLKETIQKEATYEAMPLCVTLMITEKCNLKCRYCYEIFSGNMKAKSMDFKVAKDAIDFYMSPENRELYPNINWDIVGGELFVEFELLKKIIDYLIEVHIKYDLCPKQHLSLSLCSNGTLFTPEVRKWCEELKNRIAWLSIGISLDGPKHVHDLNRSNSFDRVMDNFDWWRFTFPNDAIKGTMGPDTIQYLYEDVMFFVKELKLPRFYINPTFEGPWNEELATLYSEELIKCMEYFLKHPEYRVLKNSNIFHDTRFAPNEKRNWCGSGIYMRAITPEGDIYSCLRSATSRLNKLGNIYTGIETKKIIPFYFYTKYNDVKECDECKFASLCPSCVMEWVEHTGDMFIRSTKSCLMTKARLMVSDYYCQRTTEPQRNFDE